MARVLSRCASDRNEAPATTSCGGTHQLELTAFSQARRRVDTASARKCPQRLAHRAGPGAALSGAVLNRPTVLAAVCGFVTCGVDVAALSALVEHGVPVATAAAAGSILGAVVN